MCPVQHTVPGLAGLAARYKHTSGVLASHWSVNTGFSRLIGQNSGDLNAWDNIHICICLVSTVNYHFNAFVCFHFPSKLFDPPLRMALDYLSFWLIFLVTSSWCPLEIDFNFNHNQVIEQIHYKSKIELLISIPARYASQ